MFVGLRLKDEAVAKMDIVAKEQGVSRSRWIASLIERELAGQGAPARLRPKRSGARQAITIRVPVEDAERIDRAADALGMKRSHWIVKMIEGRLWDGEGRVTPSPLTQAALGSAINQIVRIGRNVNQAVHAINAAVLPGSGLDIARCAEQLAAMREDIREEVAAAEDKLFALAIGEQRYWRGTGNDGDVQA